MKPPEAPRVQPSPHVREQLARRITPEEYERIRELWKTHSLAEDARDIAGLLSTLTPDCVYEVLPTGTVWRGHEGAAAFYSSLLGAFPDVEFHLQNIVIGPQGVFEEAHVTATHQGDWLDLPATGQRVEFAVVIFFPWDRQRGLFTGERVWFDRSPFGA
jgi:predicted ester cyclase